MGQEILGQNSVLLTPTMPKVAPFHREPQYFWKDMNFSAIASATELPCTSVPLGLNKEGLPLGLQVLYSIVQLFFLCAFLEAKLSTVKIYSDPNTCVSREVDTHTCDPSLCTLFSYLFSVTDLIFHCSFVTESYCSAQCVGCRYLRCL